MATLFISDLHLHPSRPAVTNRFLRFLEESATTTSALYILGDLFEVWIGDDDPDPHQRRIIKALRQFTDTGPECFFARGNRDVIIGRRFCTETGARLLEASTVIELYNTRVLISHGDELCTHDRAYQRFRRRARSPMWQALFLALPLPARNYLAQYLRRRSIADTALKPEDIIDVSQQAVADAFAEHRVTVMIHGHTHRCKIHNQEVFSKPQIRIVLGDWHEEGSTLRWDESGYRLETLTINAGNNTE
ncbi:MAG: UDP-2,3-diacylglucosamine diphosphatase [Gammaproteobacteria bacterium]|jgi:UDP-2,3-diacylglucosamine hydrolase|nr:UDP-2,3-diacylglucosamine diphosphatase [Chromatiales bacterium]MCP4927070.1 UDP-2,3-diacylglucosamine diphosphatase [Gammaproteobacteria bacterium]MDP7296889.1 UDP-2,3-diacylglucosamine diphosphatase [Gammaproteobacteria bacterium]MDP7419473.1 UDP-2,3-diacylglucosamine diphosphatase [Gammaproteobacteria bacterium]MDP7661182.1 UDP-2,3-diacylglucosamine diphosphatase [Gammaproteobacteria bacterium]